MYSVNSQEMVSVAFHNVKEMENILTDPSKNDLNGSSHNNINDPYKYFVSTNVLVVALSITPVVMSSLPVVLNFHEPS